MKKLIGYCRVSTERQSNVRNGLLAQREEILRFAKTHGYEVISIVEESISGKYGLEFRPILSEAIEQANKIGATIVVSKLDRFSRDALFVMQLMKTKLKFVVAELGEEITPFMLHIYCVCAEQERVVIGKRTKAGLEQVKAKGVVLGNKKNLDVAGKKGAVATAVMADKFADIMKPIAKPMLESGMSLRAVAKALNDKEVKTARGGVWTAQTVANIRSRW